MKYNKKFKPYPKVEQNITADEFQELAESTLNPTTASISDLSPLMGLRVSLDNASIDDLVTALEGKVNLKVDELESLENELVLNTVQNRSKSTQDETLWQMALIVQELIPVLYLVKNYNPKKTILFDALIEHYNKNNH